MRNPSNPSTINDEKQVKSFPNNTHETPESLTESQKSVDDNYQTNVDNEKV